MPTLLPKINPGVETERIISFIKKTLRAQNFDKVVVGVSGGVDSTSVAYLLSGSLPTKNIIAVHMYYYHSHINLIKTGFKKCNFPKDNILQFSIKNTVDEIAGHLGLSIKKKEDNIRFGNILARVRMIVLYDLAKKYRALVSGTENRSEYLLGYFTRFGDQASDFEPIQHLYKSQVYDLAKYLGISGKIIRQVPTAGLWSEQTDEGEFGFTYKEADQVLHLYFDKHLPVETIIKKGLTNTKKIINWSKKSNFKHKTPYILPQTNHD